MATLGRYEILDKLGAGSMGTVYRARDTILDREVALKTIRTGSDVHLELRERFYREARACARLQHPSIVVVYDLGEIDHAAFIAMELLTGSDFRTLIERRTEIPIAIKLEAMAQVCEALAYAHRNNIVHRDVKPSNLFLSGQRVAKVLDFGIARLPTSQLTIQGKILGTPNYMAPEQILGQPIDGRADLFSAGVVCYEFLSYAHPFQSDNIPQRIVGDNPDSLNAAERNLPVLLERILTRALAKDPDHRYHTGDDFASDLRTLSEALLQNSSPSFSRVQLPSERELRYASPEQPSSPPGDDPYEWQLSELMRLIAEFEAALGQGDRPLAHEILAKLDDLGAADARCADAVQLCRARLTDSEPTRVYTLPGQLLGAATSPEVSTSSGDPGSSPRTCAYCGASNRNAAVYCIQCGGRLAGTSAKSGVPGGAPPPPEVPAQQAEAPINLRATMMIGPTTEAPSAPPADPAVAGDGPVRVPPAPAVVEPIEEKIPSPVKRPGSPRLPRYTWLAAAGLVSIIVIAILAWPARSFPIQHAVATALVASPKAFIHETTDPGAKTIAVEKGERVNVLQLPPQRDAPWIQVQLVRENKGQRPGYIRASDVPPPGWDSPDADGKLALILFFGPGAAGDDQQIGAELADLQKLIDHSAGSAAARKAHLDMAELELALAKRSKDAGREEAVWQSHLESARTHVNAVSDAPELAGAADNLKGRIAELEAKQPAETPAPAPTADPVVRAKALEIMVKQAQDLFDADKIDEAEKKVDRVLRIQRDNQAARELKERIQRRRKVDVDFK